MSDAPVFYPVPVIQEAALPATANTATDGTGALTEVARGSATKIRKIDRIRFKMLATNTASQIVLFFSSDSGTTKRLIAEIAAPAITKAAGTPGWEGTWYAEGFSLENDNCRIYAGVYTAHAVNAVTEMFEP